MCVHNHVYIICAFVTELCVDYCCVPIAVYHHEPSRQNLKELEIKIKLLISTTTQSCSMHVRAMIVYVSYYREWIGERREYLTLVYLPVKALFVVQSTPAYV